MTENEAIKELHTSIDLAKMCTRNSERKKEIESYKMAIQALEEIQQYRAIGTVGEFRNAMERMNPRKPILSKKQDIRYVSKYDCPSCGKSFTGTCSKSCYHCGQALDWGE